MNDISNLLEQESFQIILAVIVFIIIVIIVISIVSLSSRKKQRRLEMTRELHRDELEKAAAKRQRQTQTISSSEIADEIKKLSPDERSKIDKYNEELHDANLDAVNKKKQLEERLEGNLPEDSKKALPDNQPHTKIEDKKTKSKAQLNDKKAESAKQDTNKETDDVDLLSIEIDDLVNFDNKLDAVASTIAAKEAIAPDVADDNILLDIAKADDFDFSNNKQEHPADIDVKSPFIDEVDKTQLQPDINVEPAFVDVDNTADFLVSTTSETIAAEDDITKDSFEIESHEDALKNLYSELGRDIEEELEVNDFNADPVVLKNVIDSEDLSFDNVYLSDFKNKSYDLYDNEDGYEASFTFGKVYFDDALVEEDIKEKNAFFNNTFNDYEVFDEDETKQAFLNDGVQEESHDANHVNSFSFGQTYANIDYTYNKKPETIIFENSYEVELSDIIDVTIDNTVVSESVDNIVEDAVSEIIDVEEVDIDNDELLDDEIPVIEYHIDGVETIFEDIISKDHIIDLNSQLDELDTYDIKLDTDFDLVDHDYNYNFNSITIMDEIVEEILIDDIINDDDEDDIIKYLYQFALLNDAVIVEETEPEYKDNKVRFVGNLDQILKDIIIKNEERRITQKFSSVMDAFDLEKTQKEQVLKTDDEVESNFINSKIDQELMNLTSMVLDNPNSISNAVRQEDIKANSFTSSNIVSPIYGNDLQGMGHDKEEEVEVISRMSSDNHFKVKNQAVDQDLAGLNDSILEDEDILVSEIFSNKPFDVKAKEDEVVVKADEEVTMSDSIKSIIQDEEVDDHKLLDMLKELTK